MADSPAPVPAHPTFLGSLGSTLITLVTQAPGAIRGRINPDEAARVAALAATVSAGAGAVASAIQSAAPTLGTSPTAASMVAFGAAVAIGVLTRLPQGSVPTVPTPAGLPSVSASPPN
jgi:hypothetical protein